MKLGTFMSISAVVGLLFGLAFILMPVQTMSMYGVALDVSGQYLARYLGSAFLGIAAILWFARNVMPKDEAMKAIIMGGFIMSATGFIASVFDALYGVGNSLVWSTVVIYFLLAAGFGYFQFGKSAST
ncbi:MAG TPA: hypothetical protein DEP80_00230 [Anaerolineae bacterium]|nr:hypothetical protein [Anaerolineae bacterium]